MADLNERVINEQTVLGAKLPGEAYSENVRARFWITGTQSSYVGIGRIELLEHIAHFGSINQAAKEMSMSYKKAWKLIEELNGMYDQPLVVKVQGGKSGGGTQLTPKGQHLITQFRALEKQLQVFLTEVSASLHEL